jgi:hypothetical protein
MSKIFVRCNWLSDLCNPNSKIAREPKIFPINFDLPAPKQAPDSSKKLGGEDRIKINAGNLRKTFSFRVDQRKLIY